MAATSFTQNLANLNQTIQSRTAQIQTLSQSVADLQGENVEVRQSITNLEHSVSTLRTQCRTAHEDHGTRIGVLESSPQQPPGQAAAPAERWKLENKGGQLKKFSGLDKGAFRQWAKLLKGFCNTQCKGFRKTLKTIELMTQPITHNDMLDLDRVWPHAWDANGKLYDLLVAIT